MHVSSPIRSTPINLHLKELSGTLVRFLVRTSLIHSPFLTERIDANSSVMFFLMSSPHLYRRPAPLSRVSVRLHRLPTRRCATRIRYMEDLSVVNCHADCACPASNPAVLAGRLPPWGLAGLLRLDTRHSDVVSRICIPKLWGGHSVILSSLFSRVRSAADRPVTQTSVRTLVIFDGRWEGFSVYELLSAFFETWSCFHKYGAAEVVSNICCACSSMVKVGYDLPDDCIRWPREGRYQLIQEDWNTKDEEQGDEYRSSTWRSSARPVECVCVGLWHIDVGGVWMAYVQVWLSIL